MSCANPLSLGGKVCPGLWLWAYRAGKYRVVLVQIGSERQRSEIKTRLRWDAECAEARTRFAVPAPQHRLIFK